jgi:hypothetical protein
MQSISRTTTSVLRHLRLDRRLITLFSGRDHLPYKGAELAIFTQ